MPYVTNKTSVSQVEWLASAKFQNFTYQISDVGVVANADGRKIIPSGTVYPLNDATAVGIVFNDVDVTNGPQPGAVTVEAYVIQARLPVVPVAAAITAMKEIKFR